MAKASRQQTRRVGNLSLLIAAPRPPASAVASCLEALQQQWRRDGHLAALWQAWPRIAGPQLARHCRPLQLQAGLLTVGAAPGPWLQALQYHRHQLLGAMRGAGFTVRDLRLQQYHASAIPAAGSSLEAEIWARHPSRVDVHGLADCPQCRRPAPAGEMARWGHCSFCRRDWLAAQSTVLAGGPGPAEAAGGSTARPAPAPGARSETPTSPGAPPYRAAPPMPIKRAPAGAEAGADSPGSAVTAEAPASPGAVAGSGVRSRGRAQTRSSQPK